MIFLWIFFGIALLLITASFFYLHGVSDGNNQVLDALFCGQTLENKGKLYSVREINLQKGK